MSERVTNILDENAAVNRTEALVDPADIRIDDLLDNEPPKRDWLLKADAGGLLPLGIVGLWAAGGGVGKTYTMLQPGVSIATGRPFFGNWVVDAPTGLWYSGG